MGKYSYTPKGVCSRQFNFEIEDGIIQSFEAIGGCNGNLKGIGCLLKKGVYGLFKLLNISYKKKWI